MEPEKSRDPVVCGIASILDHPSLYMGGPSHQSLRKAKRIVAYLEEAGLIAKRHSSDADAKA